MSVLLPRADRRNFRLTVYEGVIASASLAGAALLALSVPAPEAPAPVTA